MAAPRVVITGGGGRLAQAARPGFAAAGWDVVALDRAALDVTDRAAVRDALASLRPRVVVNLAAWTDLVRCEESPAGATRINADGVANVAAACRETGAHLVHVSSDYVFGGAARQEPYREDDEPAPLSVYGATKHAGEVAAGEGATVVRTSWISGLHGPDIVGHVLAQAADPHREMRFVDDQVGSPTMADDLVAALVLLAEHRLAGLYHVTNQGAASWFDIAVHVLTVAGQDPARVQPGPGREIEPDLFHLRPSFSVLASAALDASSIPPLRHWHESYAELVDRLLGAAQVSSGA